MRRADKASRPDRLPRSEPPRRGRGLFPWSMQPAPHGDSPLETYFQRLILFFVGDWPTQKELLPMTMNLLKEIAASRLPISFHRADDIEQVRFLRDAGLVVALVPAPADPLALARRGRRPSPRNPPEGARAAGSVQPAKRVASPMETANAPAFRSFVRKHAQSCGTATSPIRAGAVGRYIDSLPALAEGAAAAIRFGLQPRCRWLSSLGVQ
jgi:hypothetical protein